MPRGIITLRIGIRLLRIWRLRIKSLLGISHILDIQKKNKKNLRQNFHLQSKKHGGTVSFCTEQTSNQLRNSSNFIDHLQSATGKPSVNSSY